ncbi:MAG: triose-phosphate isomerase [Gemmatimonadetes bacterium]|nr:triose-phosphate isomerase [Gemmatimonadota bacterium]
MRDDVKPMFAANWKMHLGPDETETFVDRFGALHSARQDARVVFFPPYLSVGAFLASARTRPDLGVGVQDVHQEVNGAHTGAVSAPMAKQAGAGWALAGHSERRREFGDDDVTVAAKVARILEADLRPVLCVGETLEEREAGALEAVLSRQIEIVLASLAPDSLSLLTYAYEPVWAIGTGRTASPDDAAQAHTVVRREIGRCGGRDDAVILYGGSVKPGNIEELLEAPGVDGVLVGGASLDPESFAAICAGGG